MSASEREIFKHTEFAALIQQLHLDLHFVAPTSHHDHRLLFGFVSRSPRTRVGRSDLSNWCSDGTMVKMFACACNSTPFLANSSLSLITEAIWPRIDGWLRLPRNPFPFQKTSIRCSDHQCLCLTRRSFISSASLFVGIHFDIQSDRVDESSRLKLGLL